MPPNFGQEPGSPQPFFLPQPGYGLAQTLERRGGVKMAPNFAPLFTPLPLNLPINIFDPPGSPYPVN